MKEKKQQARESHMECHHKMQARIHEAEDTIQEQQLVIEALVEEKSSLLQTIQGSYQEAEDTIQEQHMIIEALVEEKASLVQIIQGLQEDNDAPAPFDDEWEEEAEEEPEEEGLEDIPLGEGEIIEE
ncbi:protein tipD-like [Dorcoceras hygrometricum]|uniref:Protein tipD-like n=1 Tax=Dorcoceras hygrometricum TaxID=472368 RepID=A0A2Z7D811_9LAMI|nr:protein tipD-like [Dorcoceras hygrometricum]